MVCSQSNRNYIGMTFQIDSSWKFPHFAILSSRNSSVLGENLQYCVKSPFTVYPTSVMDLCGVIFHLKESKSHILSTTSFVTELLIAEGTQLVSHTRRIYLCDLTAPAEGVEILHT